MRKTLIGIAAAAAVAVALPLHALAYNLNFSFSVSPTTAGSYSTTTSSNAWDPNKNINKMETDLPSGETVAHHGDAGTPADGTTVGSASATAHWLISFCGTSTQTFLVKWINPDGGYSETGWTVTSEVQITSSFFGVSFDGYVLENASGVYKIVVPSVPHLACLSSTYAAPSLSITLGSYNGNTYNLNLNPSTVGTFTVSLIITYSDATTDTGSTTYTTT